ncbi:hypothetical protein Q5O14_03925 [Eubacteriaceae bacterium ES2]|nr:hypothetical protein Q5O14_03925 [Eubacteriaceae bacterium ES2]
MIINTPLQINIISKMKASLKQNVTKDWKRFINSKKLVKKIMNAVISVFGAGGKNRKFEIVNMWINDKKQSTVYVN